MSQLTITITIGPEGVPESKSFFRTYAPTEAYFDKSWKLNDIQRIQ
jgi:hypothetical protein